MAIARRGIALCLIEEIVDENGKHVYGKYGTLKKKYLEDKGVEWTIADLPSYLHGVDEQAADLYETLFEKLSADARYERTGIFLEDYRRQTNLQRAIEEEILNEIVYTNEIV